MYTEQELVGELDDCLKKEARIHDELILHETL